jgi:hypothetical protein
MRSVRFVEPGDGDAPASEGTVIVQSEDGERFELTVDDSLRAAVATPGQLDSAGEEKPAVTTTNAVPSGPPLTPRDIQVRVRSGESPEDLAADSGTPLDKIMRFAFPVMEERARISDEARRARARRDGDGAFVPFGDTVDRRFVAHGIDPATVLWDSFRRPDGSWVVIATWPAGEHERHAHWAFSLAARTVLPADEVGSDLLSDRPLRPIVRAVPDPEEQAAIAARDELYDQEAPPPYPARPYQPTNHGAPSNGPTHEEPPLPLRLADPLPRPSAVPSPNAVTGSIGFDELFDANVVDAREEKAPPKRSGRSKSAREQTKIPSWDDILLGVRRKQD